MIVGVAKSHALHAAEKVQQVQLPPSWNARPPIAFPLHVAFISSDFRAHVTAHLVQVMAGFVLCVCTRPFLALNGHLIALLPRLLLFVHVMFYRYFTS
jgi:hypothetical protein